MTRRVVLHVGAMKTGTSYVQNRLAENREELLAAGVLVARGGSRAVHDLLAAPRRPATESRACTRLVAALHASPSPTAVLSHELLGLVAAPRGRELAALLAGEGWEVHVVVSVRDAVRTLPALWQTHARNRGTMTWPEYAAAARTPGPPPPGHRFRRAESLGRALRVWGVDQLPAQRHVVTVPERSTGPDVLWERFAHALGVHPGVARRSDVAANASADHATAHLLCLLHRALDTPGLPAPEVRRLLVHVGARAGLRDGARPPVDADTLAFAEAWNQRNRDAARTHRAQVWGTLDDLPTEHPGSRIEPMAPPTEAEVVEAAAAAARVLTDLVSGTAQAGGPTVAVAGPDKQQGPPPAGVQGAVQQVAYLVRAALATRAVDRLNGRGTRIVR